MCNVFVTRWIDALRVQQKALFFKCKNIEMKIFLRFSASNICNRGCVPSTFRPDSVCSCLPSCSLVSARLKRFIDSNSTYVTFQLCVGRFISCRLSSWFAATFKNTPISNTFHGADSVSDSLSASTLAISLWPFHQLGMSNLIQFILR